ncbi:MAG: hypothetical protein H6719_05235 [Sandaracinaceae bacterium]|nr:hypothetical protein [Sandaracinaceae bacterium]
MSWLDAIDGGPLVPAARRFLSEHPGAPAQPFPNGVGGIRALSHAVEAWADEEASPLDEGFVEGAGALLSLLLLDHVGEGGHVARDGVHRLRLGRDGFFDPFGAIDAALEADDPRAVLAEAVARAEAEASGAAGVGRALRILRERLDATRPDLRVEAAFGPSVRLSGEIEVDLARVLRATAGEPDEAARQAIDKLVTMLPGGGGALSTFADLHASLLPRVTAPGFAGSLADRGRLAHAPRLGGAIELTVVVGYEDRARYLGEAELERWGRSFDEVLAVAIENLASRSAEARFGRVDTEHGALVLARTGDGLDSARLLLPTLHSVLGPELGDGFLAAIPHRDVLLACADTPPLRAVLAKRATEDAARAPHPITDRLFRVTAERLALA